MRLRQLSYKLRIILVLRYYDLTYTDVQEILKIPLGTVKSRIYQALSDLRPNLASDVPRVSASISERECNPMTCLSIRLLLSVYLDQALSETEYAS